MNKIVIGIVGVGVLGAVLYFAIKNQSAPTPSQGVQVVAAENFWGNVAAQIGGSLVNVTSIISDPSADPHQYESNAQDALALSQSRIVIENGLGYDDFMDKLLASNSKNDRTILSVADTLGVAGNDANPHLWYDIANVHKVSAAIGKALAKADPGNASEYAANAATFDASLNPILDTIQVIKTKYPHAPVAYTERVPQYLLDAAGLDNKTPPAFAASIEDGNEPSPADTQAMNTLITGHGIKALLYNAQATSPVTEHLRDLATQNGIQVVGVTETMPTDTTYQVWQLHQTQALLQALGG